MINAAADVNPNKTCSGILSKFQLTGKLLNTYDNYIKEKYKIDINYNALNTVKNYFN